MCVPKSASQAHGYAIAIAHLGSLGFVIGTAGRLVRLSQREIRQARSGSSLRSLPDGTEVRRSVRTSLLAMHQAKGVGLGARTPCSPCRCTKRGTRSEWRLPFLALRQNNGILHLETRLSRAADRQRPQRSLRRAAQRSSSSASVGVGDDGVPGSAQPGPPPAAEMSKMFKM